MQDSHFAVLGKEDFNKSIGKIERNYLNKKIDFLQAIPCFRNWAKNSVGKFTYYLEKASY